MPTDAPSLELLRRSAHLSLDAEGELLHEGEPIVHSGLHALFQAGLDVHESGEAIVRVGKQWAFVHSAGSPFVVQRMRFAEPAVVLALNTGETLEIPAAQLRLRLHGDHELTVALPNRIARFGRRAWHALADDLLLDDAGQLWLQLGPHRVPVAQS